MDNKKYFDQLVKKYETPDFIKSDPVQFPHRFTNQDDIEVSALVSTALAYGNRKHIIENLEKIHLIVGKSPAAFCKRHSLSEFVDLFAEINYRYNTGKDVALLFFLIGQALKEFKTLENLFLQGFNPDKKNIKEALIAFVDALYKYIPENEAEIKGLLYLIPNPAKGSACKRLNLFLKWMVRKPPVDFGIWNKIPTKMLLIPLDTHVAKLSRKFKLTSRASNDWKTAEEITDVLKSYDPNDPAKYDFALFGLGVSGEAN